MSITEGKIRQQVKDEPMTERPKGNPPPASKDYVYVQTSEREKQWEEFSQKLAQHLREYTVPQYGDVGEDEITNYTVEQCVEHIKRYAKRYGSQSRDGQQELDFMKIAHYAQCAWEKYTSREEVEPKEEHLIILDEEVNLKNFEFVGSSTSHQGQLLYVYKKKEQ